MKKFVNLCKKPLLIATAVVFALFLILVIAVSCLPHGNKYVFEIGITGYTQRVEYVLKGNGMLELKAYVNGVDKTEEMFGKETSVPYSIEKGVLYIKNPTTGESQKVGKINAYRIILDSEEPDAEMAVGMKMTCPLTCGLRDASIAFIVLGGLGLAGCIVVLVLDKKGLIKYNKQTQAVSAEDAQPVEKTEGSEE